MLEKAAEFIKNCDPKDTLVVHHGGCGDGIAAAAILAKTFERYSGERPNLAAVSPNTISNLRVREGKVIFVDLPADQSKDFTLELSKKADVMVIDHHKYLYNLNDYGILHVHPEFFSDIKGVRYPGSKLAYDICKKVAEINDMDWIAAVGTIHDIGGEQWKSFIDKVFEKYPELGEKSYDFNSKLGLLASILTSSQEMKGGDKIAVQLLLDSERPSDILDFNSIEAKKLNNLRQARAEEIEGYVKNWRELSEFHEKEQLAFLKLEPKYKVSDATATVSSLRNPDILFVVMTEDKDKIKLSFRQNKSKIDCSWLAAESTKAFDGTGGGHPPAAGGMIKAKYLDDFKAKVLDLVRSKLK